MRASVQSTASITTLTCSEFDGRPLLISGFERSLHVRTRRKADVEALEANLRDVDRLPGRIMKRRMEVELIEADERLERRVGFGNVNPFHVSRRPDAKAFPLAPDAPFPAQRIAQRKMEAVEFDAGMKAVRKRLNDLLAHKWLGTMCRDVDEDANGNQERKNAAANPKWPAGQASTRVPGLSRLHL